MRSSGGIRGGHAARARLLRATVVGAVVIGVLVGCSSGESASGPSADSSSSAPTTSDPTSAGPAQDDASGSESPSADEPTQDSTDGSEDSGEQNPDGAFVEDPDAYDDEPAPPASEAMVLCNLSQPFLSGLADVADGQDGGSISLAVVALDDNIQVWRPLVGFYPEATADLDRAESVLDLWHSAMDSQDDGDERAAQDSLDAARAEIDQVAGPSDALSAELGCVS